MFGGVHRGQHRSELIVQGSGGRAVVNAGECEHNWSMAERFEFCRNVGPDRYWQPEPGDEDDVHALER